MIPWVGKYANIKFLPSTSENRNWVTMGVLKDLLRDDPVEGLVRTDGVGDGEGSAVACNAR